MDRVKDKTREFNGYGKTSELKVTDKTREINGYSKRQKRWNSMDSVTDKTRKFNGYSNRENEGIQQIPVTAREFNG